MIIIGVSCFYHDSAVTLIKDGGVRWAVQEERFTRRKNESSFPYKALEFVLRSEGIELSDVDAVVYYEKPWIKFDRILESYIYQAPFGLKQFVKSFPLWIKHKLFLKQELLKTLKAIDSQFSKNKLLFSEHHLSHAASAFYPSPFEKALVVTFDGVGEWSTASVSVGDGRHLEIKEELRFPDSIGLLYSTFTAYCGFKVNSGEYKVMGLAPYGVPRFYEILKSKVIHIADDGALQLELQYFDFSSDARMHSRELEKLLGIPPRQPEALLEQCYMDLAASLQKLLEFILLEMLKKIRERYPLDHLCLAGGVVLNCVANTAIQQSGLFKSVWVQPVAGDAGGSWGAALAAHFLHFQQQRRETLQESSRSLYLGPCYSEEQILNVCDQKQFHYHRLSSEELVSRVVEDLINGHAVGWFQGSLEFGPRALGARSILAHPCDVNMQRRLNLKTKFRESFRPFAPIVLAEDVAHYFQRGEASPYMMFVDHFKKTWRFEEPPQVSEAFGLDRLSFKRSEFPAVTHLDYSARLQTVSSVQNPLLHSVLKVFKERTGHGILVNTSFNVRGEPIVCSPEDALNCFMATDLDSLYMGHICLYKTENQREDR